MGQLQSLNAPSRSESALTRRAFWPSVGLAIFTIALYAGALRCQFLAFDDPVYVTGNPLVRAGLTLHGIAWAFSHPTGGNWHPLTMLSHMLDCQIYGLHPWGHHLTNVLFHAANSVLLFLLLTRLTGTLGASFLAALLFSVHPAHVESVVWISERKDVLCAFFYLLAIWAYAGGANLKNLALATLFMTAALMSKPMAITLPFVLLLLDFWPLRRPVGFHLILEKIPMFFLSGAFCAITIWAQGVGNAIATEAQLSLGERINHAFISYSAYIRLLVWPRHLAAFYPYQHHEPIWWGITAAASLVVLTLLFFSAVPRKPHLLVGWLWFLGTLVPVIGLVQVGGQAWADRYTYLPSVGIFILVAWSARQFVWQAVLVLVCGVLAVLTLLQVRYWHDTRTLFQRAIDVTPNNYPAMTTLGGIEELEGRINDAIALLQASLRLKPEYAETHFFLAKAFEDQGRTADAWKEYQEALRREPDFAAARVAVGLQWAAARNYDQAIEQYRLALQSDPNSISAQTDWALALMQQNRVAESIPHFEQALHSDPAALGARIGLGVAYLRIGQLNAGVAELRQAYQLDPSNPEIQSNLGQALNAQGKWRESLDLLRAAAARPPINASIQFQCGLAAEHLGEAQQAVNYYHTGLAADPNNIDALQHAAWIEATDARPAVRNGRDAVVHATRARDLTGGKRASILLTLAAAYAEAGRPREAVFLTDKAIALARGERDENLAQRALRLRAIFAAGQAYHGG